jgi:hypothetical protein
MADMRHLSTHEESLLDSPPDSHRITLDGHCALAGARGQVVHFDPQSGAIERVFEEDLALLPPQGWVS